MTTNDYALIIVDQIERFVCRELEITFERPAKEIVELAEDYLEDSINLRTFFSCIILCLTNKYKVLKQHPRAEQLLYSNFSDYVSGEKELMQCQQN